MMKKNLTLIIPFLLLIIQLVKGQQLDRIKIQDPKLLNNFDYNRPVFELESEVKKNINGNLRFSVLTGYRDGVKPTKGLGNFESVIDKTNWTVRTYMMNLSIYDLLTMGLYKPVEVLLEVRNPSSYRYDSSQGSELEWLRRNAYCFEFLMPYGAIKGVKTLQKEISHYFGIECKREKRTMDVLVLVRTSEEDKIKTAGKSEGKYDMKGYFNNVPIDRLSHPLSDAGLIMIDETGYKGNIDLNLKIKSWKDISALRLELERYDLDFKQEKRKVNMLVISDKSEIEKGAK